MVNYSYLADGTKESSLKSSGAGLVYRGPFVYRRAADGTLTLESAGCTGGKLLPDRTLAYVRDHLGSVCAVIDADTEEYVEASTYSTYGGREEVILPLGTLSDLPLRDHFTGQEDQKPEFGLPYSDHGARLYSPDLRRWMVPDPLSEKYYGISPYCYCADNPLNLVDLDGKKIYVKSDSQNLFKEDLRRVFGDKSESFVFDDTNLLIQNISNNDFKKGLSYPQKKCFEGLMKAMTSDSDVSIQYVSRKSDAGLYEQVMRYGGGMYDTSNSTITISVEPLSPADIHVVVEGDNGTIHRTYDDKILQNTTSILFHEIGEFNIPKTILYREGAIDFENYARRILKMSKRPHDIGHYYQL